MRSGSRTTIPRRAGALLAAGLVAVSSACGTTSDSDLRAQLCPYFEEDDYPELESLATRTLDGLDHSVERQSLCEEWGRPGAVLVAELPDRPSREDVLDLLADRGWEASDETGGGVYGAFVATVTTQGESGPVVLIRFSRGA